MANPLLRTLPNPGWRCRGAAVTVHRRRDHYGDSEHWHHCAEVVSFLLLSAAGPGLKLPVTVPVEAPVRPFTARLADRRRLRLLILVGQPDSDSGPAQASYDSDSLKPAAWAQATGRVSNSSYIRVKFKLAVSSQCKKSPFQVTLSRNMFFRCPGFGSDLPMGTELTLATSFLRQNSLWACIRVCKPSESLCQSPASEPILKLRLHCKLKLKLTELEVPST